VSEYASEYPQNVHWKVLRFVSAADYRSIQAYLLHCCSNGEAQKQHGQSGSSSSETSVQQRQARDNEKDQVCAYADVDGIVLHPSKVLINVHLPWVGRNWLGL
jgi:hypothetical protein